jgi:hypothetical protein
MKPAQIQKGLRTVERSHPIWVLDAPDSLPGTGTWYRSTPNGYLLEQEVTVRVRTLERIPNISTFAKI